MQFERFTEIAQEALQNAAHTAEETDQQAVEPEHLLLVALVRERDGITRSLLDASGVSPTGLEAALVSEVETLPKVQGAAPTCQTP